MPASPVCLVQNGVGQPFVGTANGVNVVPGQVISIKLLDPSAVTSWSLEVFGTDETSVPPSLTNVDPTTGQVTSPTTIVSFTWPGAVGDGRAMGFRTSVNGGGTGLTGTFGLFSLSTSGNRVGFFGQTDEGDPNFGWITLLNPTLRSGGGGGSGNATSIQGTLVQPGGATIAGQTVVYDGSTEYKVRQLTQDDILPSFNIASFSSSPSGYVELGATITNPTFTASYTTNPDFAANSVTVQDSVGGPLQDQSSAPYSFTYSEGYTYTTYGATVSFTLTAKKGLITRTATTGFEYVQNVYFGAAASGQSSAAFIQTLTGQLAASRATTFSVNAGAGQSIYYAYRTPYGAATFTVGGFQGGFNLVSTTIAVTNQYGITENYTLYESAQTNLGPTTVQVT